MREQKDLRIFFALWPEQSVRRQIVDLCSRIRLNSANARFITAANIHMTLHFIGNIRFSELACLRSQAAQLSAEAFELEIDCQGYFGKPRVLWLGCRQAPQALFDLQYRLGEQLSRCGFSPETRPYNPHVSIARNLHADCEAPAFPAIAWKINRFVLVESRRVDEAVEYRVIDEYALV